MSETFCECYPHRTSTQNETEKLSQYFCNCLCIATLVNNDLLLRAAQLGHLSQPLWFDTNDRCSGFPEQPVSCDKCSVRIGTISLVFILCSACWNYCLFTVKLHLLMAGGTQMHGEVAQGCAPSWNTSQGRGGIAFCSCQLSGTFLKYQMHHGYDFPLASKFVIMKNSSHYEKLLQFFLLFLNTIAEITKLVCITSYF